jgi:hypothetical protein
MAVYNTMAALWVCQSITIQCFADCMLTWVFMTYGVSTVPMCLARLVPQKLIGHMHLLLAVSNWAVVGCLGEERPGAKLSESRGIKTTDHHSAP